MKAVVFVLLLMSLASTSLLSQQDADFLKYSASTIPDSLTKNADAVYRLDEGYVDVISPSRYSFKVHNIVTLLNKNAQRHLNHSIAFDKFNKVESIEIRIFNAFGILVKKYTKKDFQTINYDDRMSLYTDDKLLVFETAAPGYPCTIETSYERKATSYIGLPGWSIVSPGEAVERSSFTVKVPAALGIRHSTYGMKLTPSVDTSGEGRIYTWTAHSIVAEKQEADAYESQGPYIQVVPHSFQYDGYAGDMKTWQAFGQWNYQFYNDPKPFDKIQTAEILAAVEKCHTDRDKVKVLYERLKKSMRYVSIQLGIGGFKPFPVQYVHEKKYGDCKALTNYMRYMLKAAGINSYPALVNAGYKKPPANPDFPAQVFNHVILCVPLSKDTIWLECTSNISECGVLGNFTENKNALLLTENGGLLIPTPKSNYRENFLSTSTIINISEEGGSKATSNIYCKGEFWELFHSISQQSNEEQKSVFVNTFNYKNPEHFAIQYKGDSAEGKLFSVNLEYEQHYDFKAGSKLFIPQKIGNLCNEAFRQSRERKHDYIFSFPYQRTDTTIFVLPAGTTVETLPVQREVSNNYVQYKNRISKNEAGNIITVIGELSIKNHVIPAKHYLQVMDYLGKVNQNEKEKIVLKKG